jgi:hypothetical protein
MAQLGEVVFALERFEWADDSRLDVVGRWEGLQGRRMGRPVLTFVEPGGRRRRLSALPGGQLSGEQPWRASFACDGGTVAVERAELELGRRLVVELPPPRRRRRRPAPPPPRAAVANGTANAPPAVAPEGAELPAGRSELGAARAELAATTDERDALSSELATIRAERDDISTQLRATRDALAEREQRLLAAESDAVRAEDDAARRLDAERAETADLRTRLAAAREEAEQARTEASGTIAAEAQETERLRGELTTAREEADEAIAAARAEAATVRQELADRSPPAAAADDADAGTRRMLETVTRDLERERATVRTLRREIEALQAETAEHRRAAAVAGATAPIDAGHDSRLAARAHRVDVARSAGAGRVPPHRHSVMELWGARIVASVLVGLLLLALALIVTPLL